MESNYINLIPERDIKTYHFSQNDSNRTIRCGIYNGVLAVDLTGKSVRLRYKKPDGTISSISAANISGSYVDFDIPDDMTDASGKVYCKLRINGIGAKAFYIDIEKGV